MKDRIRAIIAAAVARVLPEAAGVEFQVEPPRQAEHGDFAVNAALVLQKIAKAHPRKLAQMIVEKISDPERIIEKIEIAGPGFLNVRLARDVWHRELQAVWEQRDKFGRSNTGKGLRTMVEFVSANPTGPMHVGHGRGAVLGDVI
ncbi:MAG TPA: arginine--tRNA ligase, partial [Myxococcales bacterium]